MAAATTPFAETCEVYTGNNYDTCGSLTLSNLSIATPSTVLGWFKTTTSWHEMSAFLKTQFEMKACGIKRNGLYDWIMTSNKKGQGKLINVTKMAKGPSLVQPFIMGRQESVVNTDLWTIDNGVIGSGYAASGWSETPLEDADAAASDWVIRLRNDYDVGPLDNKWFLAGQYIYLTSTKDGAVSRGQWKVVASAATTDGTYIDVGVDNANPTNTGIDTEPTVGYVLAGINNVNDFESWCHNPANYNPIKHVPFWYQTRRRTRCVDSTYKAMFRKLMEDNAYFAEFGDLSLAERNRQDEAQWQRQFVNAFFFNREISSNQTLTGWNSLETINSVTSSVFTLGGEIEGTMVGKRANFVGVYWQLKDCSRIKDLQNQAMNIDEFFTQLKEIYRARQSQGKANANQIDAYMPNSVAERLEVGIIQWYKNKYGSSNVQINITPGENTFGFQWRSFRLPFYNIVLNVITNETLDDIASLADDISTEESDSGAIGSTGRWIAILDLGKGGTIYPAILDSARAVHTVGEIENLAKLDSTYACTIKNPTKDLTLTSETITVVVECPKNSLWIEGIGDAAMVYTGATAPTSNLY